MWPAWCDVSNRACGVWGHVHKSGHKSKELCRVIDSVDVDNIAFCWTKTKWLPKPKSHLVWQKRKERDIHWGKWSRRRRLEKFSLSRARTMWMVGQLFLENVTRNTTSFKRTLALVKTTNGKWKMESTRNRPAELENATGLQMDGTAIPRGNFQPRCNAYPRIASRNDAIYSSVRNEGFPFFSFTLLVPKVPIGLGGRPDNRSLRFTPSRL